jgi:hypothetical protein
MLWWFLILAVSAGAAVFPHDGTTYETLLAEADHRMYRDKAARRGEGVGSYFPPMQPRSLFMQVSVACTSMRRNSLSSAAIFCACGVNGGIRPFGGSTICDVCRLVIGTLYQKPSLKNVL